jgi:hypothetical protein
MITIILFVILLNSIVASNCNCNCNGNGIPKFIRHSNDYKEYKKWKKEILLYLKFKYGNTIDYILDNEVDIIDEKTYKNNISKIFAEIMYGIKFSPMINYIYSHHKYNELLKNNDVYNLLELIDETYNNKFKIDNSNEFSYLILFFTIFFLIIIPCVICRK